MSQSSESVYFQPRNHSRHLLPAPRVQSDNELAQHHLYHTSQSETKIDCKCIIMFVYVLS